MLRIIIRLFSWFLRECTSAFDRLRTELARLFPGWVTAHHLTFARLFLTAPLIVCTQYYPRYRWTGYLVAMLVVSLLALVLDALDGPLARIRGRVSAFGSMLDAGTDKILTFVHLNFTALMVEPMRVWIYLFLGLEVVHGAVGIAVNARRGLSAPLESNLPGKWKMLAVTIAMGCGFIAVWTGELTDGPWVGWAIGATVTATTLAVTSMTLHLVRIRRARLTVVPSISEPPASSA